jgi:hypothetical protein
VRLKSHPFNRQASAKDFFQCDHCGKAFAKLRSQPSMPHDYCSVECKVAGQSKRRHRDDGTFCAAGEEP